jgi:uncharacterized membrane protein YeaQ/YmgE (transglycosylase-associated protein family)
MPKLSSVHLPTVVLALIGAVVLIGLYHLIHKK